MQVLQGGIRLRALRQQISAASKQDWKDLLLHRANKLVHAVTDNDSHTKFSILRAMKPYVPKTAQRLKDAEGNLTNCLHDEQKVVKGFFGDLLGGTLMSLEQLIVKDRRGIVGEAD